MSFVYYNRIQAGYRFASEKKRGIACQTISNIKIYKKKPDRSGFPSFLVELYELCGVDFHARSHGRRHGDASQVLALQG